LLRRQEEVDSKRREIEESNCGMEEKIEEDRVIVEHLEEEITKYR
jgi:hypothetical protein